MTGTSAAKTSVSTFLQDVCAATGHEDPLGEEPESNPSDLPTPDRDGTTWCGAGRDHYPAHQHRTKQRHGATAGDGRATSTSMSTSTEPTTG